MSAGKLRILYLTFDELETPFAWSVHVRSVVNRLVARGHAVRLVAPGGRAPGVDAPCDPLPPGRFQHMAGSLGAFTRSGRDFGPDVVYVRGIHLSVTPALAAGRLARPLVVELNGLLEHESPPGWRRAAVRAAHRYTLQRAARVVAVSPRLASALSRDYRFSPDRIDVVPNGADLALFRPADRAGARRRLGLPLDRCIAVCAASFYAHHAADLLVEAAARAGVLLVLVGAEGASTEGVRRAGRVPHERVPDWLAAADIGVYVLRSPHPDFGFSPLKLFEYMAAGRAVVAATDLPEIRELAESAGAGLACLPEVGALAGALARLAADPEGREAMGRRGRERAERDHGWDRTAEGVEASLLRSLAAPH
jgi:glycosyltransferase involved in cell wall biosynthesis